jgi:hypothetical protein
MEKNKSRDIICCLHKKIRTLKQSLKPLLMAAILGKFNTLGQEEENLGHVIKVDCVNSTGKKLDYLNS